MLVKGEMNHEQQFFSPCSDERKRLVSGTMYYTEAQFIVWSLFPFSVGEGEAGREQSVDNFQRWL